MAHWWHLLSTTIQLANHHPRELAYRFPLATAGSHWQAVVWNVPSRSKMAATIQWEPAELETRSIGTRWHIHHFLLNSQIHLMPPKANNSKAKQILGPNNPLPMNSEMKDSMDEAANGVFQNPRGFVSSASYHYSHKKMLSLTVRIRRFLRCKSLALPLEFQSRRPPHEPPRIHCGRRLLSLSQ